MKAALRSLGFLLLCCLIGLSAVLLMGGILYLLIPLGEAIKQYVFPVIVTRP